MKLQSEAPEVVQNVPASQAKLSLVVILAMLLGSLTTLIAVGAGLHYQQRSAWEAEVLALNDALKARDVALKETQAQNALLAKHLTVLKGYSVASSSAASEKAIKAESVASEPADGAPKAAAKTPVRPGAKKTKAQTQDCELVGKTPEQQAATLQRCVGLIDSPSAKPRQ